VVDSGNNRVEEFTINYNNVTGGTGGTVNMGTWVQTIGGGSSCTGCTSTTSCTCSTGSGLGMLNGPSDVEIDPDGTDAWVVDMYNNQLEKFTVSGNTSTYAMEIGGGKYSQGGDCSGSTGCVVSDSPENCNLCSSTTSCYCFAASANGDLYNPAGMAFDPLGNIWVTDQGNNRVEEFSSTGTYMTKFGTSGTGAGQFMRAWGIQVTR